jgi:hypothetical protein
MQISSTGGSRARIQPDLRSRTNGCTSGRSALVGAGREWTGKLASHNFATLLASSAKCARGEVHKLNWTRHLLCQRGLGESC